MHVTLSDVYSTSIAEAFVRGATDFVGRFPKTLWYSRKPFEIRLDKLTVISFFRVRDEAGVAYQKENYNDGLGELYN